MIDDDMDNYITLLYQQNEELELMLQSQSEEIEKLQQKLEAQKIKVRKLQKAGRAMHDFLEEMTMNDLFQDEMFDQAQKATTRWLKTIASLTPKPLRK
jgi:predicted RNase H-like nuclease (RuvC/YqgF family)